MKRKTFGCYCCNIRKEDLIKPNAERCEDCTALGLEWPCYHQPMSDEELMNKLADEKGTLYQEYRHLRNYPYRTSRIRHGDCAIRDHRSDYRHIAFNCDSANATEKLKFKALLKNELKLRDIQPCSDNTAELRIQVFELLLVEDRYAALAEILAYPSVEEGVNFLVLMISTCLPSCRGRGDGGRHPVGYNSFDF